MKRILFLLFFPSVIGLAKASPATDGKNKPLVLRSSSSSSLSSSTPATDKKNKPLVLQRMVSHSRNTDQISLIFRENKVELVTNTSTWQKSKTPRLGWFESSLTSSLKSFKRRLQWYYIRLKQTVPFSSLIKDRRFQPSHTPHAPVFRLNTKEVKEGGSFFKELEDIIQQIGNQNWVCVECATYQRHKKGIVRVARKQTGISNQKKDNQPKQNKKESARWLVQRKILSKKSLNCIRKTKSRWECVDEKFGIFEIESL